MEEQNRSTLMSSFCSSLYVSLKAIQAERETKLSNDLEASELQDKLHNLERQLEEERAIRSQNMHTVNTKIEALNNCDIKKERADLAVDTAVSATICKDLKMAKEQTRNLRIENISIKKQLERRELLSSSDISISKEREKDPEGMVNTLATAIGKLRKELESLNADIDGVRSLTGRCQAFSLRYEQEVQNLNAQCQGIETQRAKLGVNLSEVKTVKDSLITGKHRDNTELEVDKLELQFGKEKHIGDKHKQEIKNLEKERDIMECLVKNAKCINNNIQSVRRKDNDKSQSEIQDILDEMDVEESKWLKDKAVLKTYMREVSD